LSAAAAMMVLPDPAGAITNALARPTQKSTARVWYGLRLTALEFIWVI